MKKRGSEELNKVKGCHTLAVPGWQAGCQAPCECRTGAELTCSCAHCPALGSCFLSRDMELKIIIPISLDRSEHQMNSLQERTHTSYLCNHYGHTEGPAGLTSQPGREQRCGHLQPSWIALGPAWYQHPPRPPHILP